MGDVKWESLADLDDSFPEPEKKSQNRTYVVRIFYDTANGNYTATWGREKVWKAEGRSASTALRGLADKFETARLHGADREYGETISRQASALCKYCGAPIFFARLPYPSHKWLSFDPESVEAGKVTEIRTARFIEDNTGHGRASVLWTKSTTSGPVWIPHPECCGDKVDKPKNEILGARWEERRQVSKDKQRKVIDGLRDIVGDIDKEILNVE